MNIICYLIIYFSPNTQCLLGGIMLKMYHINTVIVQLYNAFDSWHCYIRDQIWPCRKIGKSQPRVIIWANLVVLEHLASNGDSIWHVASTGSGVSEEKMFKECGRRTDGRTTETYLSYKLTFEQGRLSNLKRFRRNGKHRRPCTNC